MPERGNLQKAGFLGDSNADSSETEQGSAILTGGFSSAAFALAAGSEVTMELN
jgi:hypothetical protein